MPPGLPGRRFSFRRHTQVISSDIPGYKPIFVPNHQEIVPGRFTDCDVLASNRWYLSAEGFIERAARRCRRTCGYRPAGSDRCGSWGLPRMRRPDGPIMGGCPPLGEPAVGEVLRRRAPRLHDGASVKHGRYQGWLYGLERLGYTMPPAIKRSTSPGTAVRHPLHPATLARIEAGLRRHQERTRALLGDDHLHRVKPLRYQGLSALIVAFADGFQPDEN
jgi:hypothetical protein